MAGVVFAKFQAHVSETVQIMQDEAWAADDPVVLAHPQFFASAPSTVRSSRPLSATNLHGFDDEFLPTPAVVEAATAEPGRPRPEVSTPSKRPGAGASLKSNT